jgi:receptor expression-enhancing protein 5/6
LWFTFVIMPEGLKRFVVVATGTLFPLMASTVCVATEDEVEETFWLTYWACFGILFLIMDWAEELLGAIPGFYSLCLVATVYLMLPLFRGAEEVFRKVLVPLAGQRDQLLIRDAHVLHKEMIRQVPAERIESVRAASIAAFSSSASASKKQE